MITLLTAVPRTGKTSYAVWDYIKPALDADRPVYVIGIPKLSLPHIKIDKEFLYSWHERQYDPEIEEDKLLNIPKGALIVVDEAWQVWPAGGIAKAPESVQHLAMHGHYGIDFLLITQKPHLMHTAVLAQVNGRSIVRTQRPRAIAMTLLRYLSSHVPKPSRSIILDNFIQSSNSKNLLVFMFLLHFFSLFPFWFLVSTINLVKSISLMTQL